VRTEGQLISEQATRGQSRKMTFERGPVFLHGNASGSGDGIEVSVYFSYSIIEWHLPTLIGHGLQSSNQCWL
jgi:hypothetical protein